MPTDDPPFRNNVVMLHKRPFLYNTPLIRAVLEPNGDKFPKLLKESGVGQRALGGENQECHE